MQVQLNFQLECINWGDQSCPRALLPSTSAHSNPLEGGIQQTDWKDPVVKFPFKSPPTLFIHPMLQILERS